MILTVRVKCVDGNESSEAGVRPIVRVIEMDENANLVDVHEAIQDAVGFDRDHLYHFYLANNSSPGARKQLLSEAPDFEDWEEELAQITLGSIWPLGRRKLYYLFDFGDEWIFEITKRPGVMQPARGVKYPHVIERLGPDPKQY